MYKLLLCWRYLKTRYLALACIISVMLGVATLIVVNSVMSGFSTKLRDRLHGLLSDVVIEAYGMEGFADPRGKMDRIRRHPFLGPRVEAMASTCEVFALLQYEHLNGETVTRPVRLIGVDPKARALVGGFKEYLVNPDANKANPSFDLPESRTQITFKSREEENEFDRAEDRCPDAPRYRWQAAPSAAAAPNQDSARRHCRQPHRLQSSRQGAKTRSRNTKSLPSSSLATRSF